MIKGGYYIKARCIQESDICSAPPHVREIWDWFLLKANHKDSAKIKRGELLCTYRDIQDGLAWFVGYRKETYKKHQCENALKWLRKAEMIATAKTTRGIIVTILNYSEYQNPKNYECHTNTGQRATMELQPKDTINKNEKNIKNVKKPLAQSFWQNSAHPEIAKKLAEKFGSRLEQLKLETVETLIKNLASDVYSGVDVCAEITKASIWEDSNPSRKKTARGLSKFLTGWMERSQNSGYNKQKQSSAADVFLAATYLKGK